MAGRKQNVGWMILELIQADAPSDRGKTIGETNRAHGLSDQSLPARFAISHFSTDDFRRFDASKQYSEHGSLSSGIGFRDLSSQS